jgi:iron complex outermembrane receptor protein
MTGIHHQLFTKSWNTINLERFLAIALFIVFSVSLTSGHLRAEQRQTPKQPAEGEENSDSQIGPGTIVVVTAPRIEIPLNEMPAATTVVAEETLKSMPRGIAAEESLRLVPGVKVDNQANGERAHISIRGQGLLTERGIRGIKVLLDGLPLNDPTGFAPDLFDVDWSAIERIEVLRGPASALFGGGAAGGVINIKTADGNVEKIAADGMVTVGSNSFRKAFSEIGGTVRDMNYRISASSNAGDGYRVHTAFRALNLYGKFRWKLGDAGHLTAIIAGTNFFNENAEGLNAAQVAEDPRQPNPDALTFNEYQRTRRATSGIVGQFKLAGNQDLSFSIYYRNSNWRESVPSSVQHRTYNTPGAITQYSIHIGQGLLKNHFTVGADMDWQTIWDYRNTNIGNAIEGERVSDDDIYQRGFGIYALDHIELGPKWNVMVDVRSDHIHNELDDNMMAVGVDLSGEANFSKTTARIGMSWNPLPDFGLYVSWGQGFLPPATEELTNNPAHLGGFNMDLKPATSYGEEIGARGSFAKRFFYDVAFFHLATENDFGRYRLPERPLETFYRNAGDSRRFGIESVFTWYPLDPLVVRLAYTYSDFKYKQVESLWGTFEDVWMPNSPRNQAYLDVEYSFRSRLFFGFSSDMVSRAYIDPTNTGYAWGYGLFNPRIAYRWMGDKVSGEIMVAARNAFGKTYIAFTEPDPDGNSYQPGPDSEVFISARIYPVSFFN